MSIKLVKDLLTPLFIAINVSPEDDVVIICDISMKEEAEGLLSHFGIYVPVIFGSIVWEVFTVSYKASMKPYQWCPVHRCVIERDMSTIASDDSFDREFAKCGLSDNMINIPTVIEYDLVQQITLHICLNIVGLLGDKNGDSGTIRSGFLMPQWPLRKKLPSQSLIILSHLQHHH